MAAPKKSRRRIGNRRHTLLPWRGRAVSWHEADDYACVDAQLPIVLPNDHLLTRAGAGISNARH